MFIGFQGALIINPPWCREALAFWTAVRLVVVDIPHWLQTCWHALKSFSENPFFLSFFIIFSNVKTWFQEVCLRAIPLNHSSLSFLIFFLMSKHDSNEVWSRIIPVYRFLIFFLMTKHDSMSDDSRVIPPDHSSSIFMCLRVFF